MEGDITSPENMGVIPRSVHAIFDYLDGISADYTVRTSFLELYNEVWVYTITVPPTKYVFSLHARQKDCLGFRVL